MAGKEEWAGHSRPGIHWGLGGKLWLAPKPGAQRVDPGGRATEADDTWHACVRWSGFGDESHVQHEVLKRVEVWS